LRKKKTAGLRTQPAEPKKCLTQNLRMTGVGGGSGEGIKNGTKPRKITKRPWRCESELERVSLTDLVSGAGKVKLRKKHEKARGGEKE